MRRVTVRTADIVAPVLSATKIVVLFLARVTGETSLGDLFRRFILERDSLFRIAFFGVSLAGTVTRFTPGNFSLPTADLC